MQDQFTAEELTGEISAYPIYPRMISLDMRRPLSSLRMYTNNLQDLAAPAELCIMKALELINDRDSYELSVETFRMELLSEIMSGNEEDGIFDINLLIAGIRCICEYLMTNVDIHTGLGKKFFPYEFYTLHNTTHLFMTIITTDAKLSAVRPATVPLPARSYPEMQKQVRADYITEANQCLVF